VITDSWRDSGWRYDEKSIPKILPGVVISDFNHNMTVPPSLSAISGINVIAHAIEALYAQNCNPVIEGVAQEEIRFLAEALPIIV